MDKDRHHFYLVRKVLLGSDISVACFFLSLFVLWVWWLLLVGCFFSGGGGEFFGFVLCPQGINQRAKASNYSRFFMQGYACCRVFTKQFLSQQGQIDVFDVYFCILGVI